MHTEIGSNWFANATYRSVDEDGNETDRVTIDVTGKTDDGMMLYTRWYYSGALLREGKDNPYVCGMVVDNVEKGLEWFAQAHGKTFTPPDDLSGLALVKLALRAIADAE